MIDGLVSSELEFLAQMGAGNRSVHLLALDRPELPEFRLPTTHFTCFLAADFAEPAVLRLLKALMKKGAVHFTGWGPGAVKAASAVQAEDCPVPWAVKAVWFEHEPLSKAVESFLENTYPDDSIDQTCGSSLAVVIGPPEWAAKVGRFLAEARDAEKAKAAGTPPPQAEIIRDDTPLIAAAEVITETPHEIAPPAPSTPAAQPPPAATRPDSGPIARPAAGPEELDLCRKLLIEQHLTETERAALPHHGRARFSVLKGIMAESLELTGWFPPRKDQMPLGAVIESREGQIWVHDQFGDSNDPRSRRVASVSDAVRAYIRHYGEPGSIDGVIIDWGG
jgi:hypothetical protein